MPLKATASESRGYISSGSTSLDHPKFADIGRYRLDGRLGAGGMGEVFRAYDRRLKRPVALKQIRPEAADDPRSRRRFRREARLAAKLQHPGIVRVYDVFQAEGSDWIVMELVEGQRLSEVLRQGRLDVKRVVALAIEITAALAEAHRLGILHRDLKAENILLTPEGNPKILDFGIAKEVHGAGTTADLTTDGRVMGTPHAMSPEQARGEAVDLRSDLFSLGSLIYRMAAGRQPFADADPLTTLNRVCLSHPAPLREIAPHTPAGLCELVERLLEKEPVRRPRSTSEVLAALARIGVPENPSGRPPPPRRSVRSLASAPPVSQPSVHPEETTDAGIDLVSTLAGPGPPMAERRQITVVLCELMAAGGTSETLDPETLFPVMAEFERTARRVVGTSGGKVVSLYGHQMVAQYGAGTVREDDSRRAVLAALELIEGCRLASDVAARVVVHTGPAVVAGNAPPVLAGTLDQAAGLLRTGRPNQLLVTGATHHLLGGDFAGRQLGAVAIEGFPRPLEVVQILGEQPAGEAWADSAGDPELVGRDAELETLLECWRRAGEGQGCAVLLSGEAGVGKSRLLAALVARVGSDDAGGPSSRVLAIRGHSYSSHAPFQPLADWILDVLGLDPQRDLGQPGEGEEYCAALRDLGLPPDRVASLSGLLGLSSEAEGPAKDTSRLREERLAALVDLLRQTARHQQVLLAVEDLQWLDESTLELLGRWIHELTEARVLFVATHRPGFEPGWPASAHWERLELDRLGVEDAQELLARLLPAESLPAGMHSEGLWRSVLDKADGVPLFLEELAAALRESGHLHVGIDGIDGADDPEVGALVLPVSLRQLLGARLDRLGPARSLAQVAAVLGREAPVDLLAVLSDLGAEEMAGWVECLLASGLFVGGGEGKSEHLVFKHALIQDAAYESLLAPRRRELHARCATLMEARIDLADARPDLLAEHWRRAGCWARAAPFFLRAGERARGLWAGREAGVFFRRAVDCVERLDHEGMSLSDDAARTRFASLEGLGDLMILERKLDEAGEFLERAAELAPGPVDQARMYRKKAHAQELHSRVAEAKLELERAEATLGGRPDEGSSDEHWREWLSVQISRLITGHRAGDLASMLDLLAEIEPMADRADPEQRFQILEIRIAADLRRHRVRPRPSTVEDARRLVGLAAEGGDRLRTADARCTLGLVLLFSGELAEAIEVLRNAEQAGREVGDGTIEMVALAYLSLAYRRQRLDESCLEASRRLLADEASPQYHGLAHANLCWARRRQGRLDAARDDGERALACWQRVPYAFEWTGRLPMAALHLQRGETERALDVLKPLAEASQMALDDEIESALMNIVRNDDPETFRASLEDLLAQAEVSRYL